MASFTDQKPRVATKKDCATRWGGQDPRTLFRCWLCGHKFRPGDVWRWVYNGPNGTINFFTCEKCDGPDVGVRFAEHIRRGKEQYWWLEWDCYFPQEPAD